MAAKDEVKKLMAKKNEIEEEIKALTEVLESQGGVGMTGKLVDNEDYPRADIDVYSVRTARHRIICLQNDHKSLMKHIEEGLYKVHTEARAAKDIQSGIQKMEVDPAEADESIAMVVVDRVDADSPASNAGLQVGDLIKQFGSVTKANFKGLLSIGEVVHHSEGKSVPVIILRNKQEQRLSLTPKKWSGRGLLGCNIVPIR